MTMNRRKRGDLIAGLAFLSPSIIGFLVFTTIPLVFSLVLAFSNWDLKLHNMFKPEESMKFVGLDNFIRLLGQPNFYKYLGNTLFFMLGVPFAIAGSLILALLLNKDMKGGGGRRLFASLIAAAVLFVAAIIMIVAGYAHSAIVMVVTCLLGGILILGMIGGSTIYRTLLYLPSFTSGVAVYVLWKKLYNPQSGPINNFLAGPLTWLTETLQAHAWIAGGMWICLIFMVALMLLGVRSFRRRWNDGRLGWAAMIVPLILLLLPVALSLSRAPGKPAAYVALAAALLLLIALAVGCFKGRDFTCSPWTGQGGALMLAAALMIGQFILLGLSIVCQRLPTWAAETAGLQPPEWISDYYWAKPAIMIMAFWAAVGSNNMLLYLAGLSNVPQELYEAADIDGASRFQKFSSVTWPQLAPTTFFIVVIGVIEGLQGGFEMARTMTNGGPAGATTTMSYFIYMEGFETGRLGYSSSVAWILFLLVFSVTMFNWKFGNRYVND